MKIIFGLMTIFIMSSSQADQVFEKEVIPSFEIALSWVKKSPLPPPRCFGP